MKRNYYVQVSAKMRQAITLTLPFMMQPITNGENGEPKEIEVSDISNLCVRLQGVGETGQGKKIGVSGETRYEIDGSNIVLHIASLDDYGYAKAIVSGKYGQVCLRAEVSLLSGTEGETSFSLPAYVFKVVDNSTAAATIVAESVEDLRRAIAELPDGQAVSVKVAEHTVALSKLHILTVDEMDTLGNYCTSLADLSEKYSLINLTFTDESGTVVCASILPSTDSEHGWLYEFQEGWRVCKMNAYEFYPENDFLDLASYMDGHSTRIATKAETGEPSDLTTENKSSIVAGINEVNGKVTELDQEVFGEETETKEYITLTSGRYYNTNTAVVGSSYVMNSPNSGSTYSCAKVAVVAGEKYELTGIGGGGTATRSWVLTGINDIVLSRGGYTTDYRTQPMVIDITEDGFLYYNTKFVDGDYLAKIVTKIDGGYKKYVDEKIASIPNAVKGKTYILCGDSQVGQTGSFPEYLEAMLHESVYMCGFGGMRYADTANTSVGPSHNPFSSCGVADALTTGDFTAIANAIDTYYPTNDRYRLALANMQEVYAKINATKGENVVLSIAYGCNDYGNSISLGSHGDGSRRTVIGAQEYAIDTLLTKYPLMQIIIVGNPWVVTSYDETTKEILEDSDQAVRTIDGTSMHRYEYSDAYLANANNHYHLKVFDMYRNSFRNRKSIWELSSDGVHPTKANGQKLLAEIYFRIFYSL